MARLTPLQLVFEPIFSYFYRYNHGRGGGCMCVAMPGRVVALDGDTAVVEIAGRSSSAATLVLPDLAVGEDVLVSAGLIIARLAPGEAAVRHQLFDRMRELATAAPSVLDDEEDDDHDEA